MTAAEDRRIAARESVMLSHDALAADLAAHLRTDRRMVWTDIQLGPSGSPRPDVYAISMRLGAAGRRGA